MAVTGSRCSSDASITNSRDRCSDLASDSLSPVAREVDTPHAVLVVIPAVSDAESVVPHEVPCCAEADPLPSPSGSTPRLADLDRAVPCDTDSFAAVETATEAESPTVLV